MREDGAEMPRLFFGAVLILSQMIAWCRSLLRSSERYVILHTVVREKRLQGVTRPKRQKERKQINESIVFLPCLSS